MKILLAQKDAKAALQKKLLEKKQDNVNLKKYEPFQIPPDWVFAKEHGKATRIAKEKVVKPGEPVDVDEMSGLQIDNELLPLGCDTTELSFLAPAYPMYFQFVKFSLWILIILMAVSGIYGVYANFHGTSCIVVDEAAEAEVLADPSKCVYTFATATSIANRGDDLAAEERQQMLNLVAFVIIVIALQVFRRKQRVLANEIDERDWTPADFTFAVHNIPQLPGQDIDEELKKFFVEHGLNGGAKLNIQKIVLSYNVQDKLSNLSKIEKLTLQKNKAFKRIERGGNTEELNARITEINKQIAELEKANTALNKEFREGVSNRFSGTAFVSVNTQKELNEVLDKWTASSKKVALPKFHGNVLKVENAEEPSDVFWENLGIPSITKKINRAIVLLIMLLILAGCFGVILAVNQWKKEITEEAKRTKNIKLNIHVQAISAAASFLIVGVNYLLATIIKKITLFEKHTQWTYYDISVATKLTWAQFFNTAIITFTVAYRFKNYWGAGGMITGMFNVFRMNCIVPAIVKIINGGYQFRKFRKYLAEREGKNSLKNQKKANELAELPSFNFPERYGELLKNMFSAAFYAPILPFGILWTLIANILLYWVNKYTLLRRSKRDRALGPALAIEMTEILEFVLVIYAASNFLFSTILFGHVSTISVTLLVLGVGNAVLPMQTINEWIFGKVEEQITGDTYEALRLTFDEDYDRCNPATSEEATMKFAEEVETVKKNQ